MSAWQPIETAPKDGTPILTCDGGEYVVVQWDEYGFWGAGWYRGDEDRSHHFTVWMPLPEPPK